MGQLNPDLYMLPVQFSAINQNLRNRLAASVFDIYANQQLLESFNRRNYTEFVQTKLNDNNKIRHVNHYITYHNAT